MTVDPDMEPLAEKVLGAWDLSPASVELVSVSENRVYRVASTEGEHYALRVHRPGYHTLAELESEVRWTRALDDAGIGVPAAIPTRKGRHFVEVEPGEGEGVRFAALTRWLSGRPLHDHLGDATVAARADAYRQLGRLMARMHEQAVRWETPAGFTRHSLDADGLMGEAPFWGRFWDLPQLSRAERRLLASARDQLHARLAALGKARAYSMIHADLHPANVLVVDGRPCAIDFDDAGFGWHAYDLAVALFFELGQPTFEATRDALVEGYRSARWLSEEDLERLPEFLLARSLAFVGWLSARPEVPLHALLPNAIDLACQRATALMGKDAA